VKFALRRAATPKGGLPLLRAASIQGGAGRRPARRRWDVEQIL